MRGLWLIGIVALVVILLAPAPSQAALTLDELLASDDGSVSIRVPSDWYLTTATTAAQTLLIATTTPERAADFQGAPPIFHVYVDDLSDSSTDALLAKTLKDHALAGLALEVTPTEVLGITGTRYDVAGDAIQAAILIIPLPAQNQWIRWVAVSSVDEWDAELVNAVQESLAILPQQASVPKGWPASVRAPLGWTQSEFSSFVQWTASGEGPFAGMEIWLQAGFRTDLIGQGDPPFVMRSFGVNYTSQVDESLAYATLLGGLPATAQPFESFTHSGIAISAEGGSDFGTANLVARAPLGQWTDTHAQLLDAIASSVQILPPTADAAPVGLRPGYRPPAFEITTTAGQTYTNENADGQLVFIHFWFVDCPYCREEWPHLQQVYDEYREDGMVLLAINAIDPLPYIQSYVEANDMDFPLVLDDGTLHDLFGVRAFPSTFIIGPDGVLVRVARGPLSERSLRNLAEEYLGD